MTFGRIRDAEGTAVSAPEATLHASVRCAKTCEHSFDLRVKLL